jgi:hypothetical protein
MPRLRQWSSKGKIKTGKDRNPRLTTITVDTRDQSIEGETRAPKHFPSASSSHSPPAIRSPIHQEIITHHKHIDHGKIRHLNLNFWETLLTTFCKGREYSSSTKMPVETVNAQAVLDLGYSFKHDKLVSLSSLGNGRSD